MNSLMSPGRHAFIFRLFGDEIQLRYSAGVLQLSSYEVVQLQVVISARVVQIERARCLTYVLAASG